MQGNSSQCPPPVNAADNTTCVDNGRCHNGECNPFCEAEQNLQSCACNGKKHFIYLEVNLGSNYTKNAI